MTQQNRRTASHNAIGLVHQPAGRPPVDRHWTRGLVVRHAHDQRLRLVDVFELEDDKERNRHVLTQLAALAVASDASALVTYGVEPRVADALAARLGVRHLPAAPFLQPRRRE